MDKAHVIRVEGRQRLTASGIAQVLGYDGAEIVAECEGARLVIQGEALRIASFEQGSGELNIEGRVDALQYLDERPMSEPFFKRLFK